MVTYSNLLPTNLAGQMWDLDFGETFLAEVYSEAGALIASKTVGPYCNAGETYPRVPLIACVGRVGTAWEQIFSLLIFRHRQKDW